VREDPVGRDGWTRFLSLVENKHREGMSERDILKSQELSLIDMDDVERSQATKALGVGRNAVKQAKAAQKLNDATLRRAAAGGMEGNRRNALVRAYGGAREDRFPHCRARFPAPQASARPRRRRGGKK
jgi:hypothetical protein